LAIGIFLGSFCRALASISDALA